MHVLSTTLAACAALAALVSAAPSIKEARHGHDTSEFILRLKSKDPFYDGAYLAPNAIAPGKQALGFNYNQSEYLVLFGLNQTKAQESHKRADGAVVGQLTTDYQPNPYSLDGIVNEYLSLLPEEGSDLATAVFGFDDLKARKVAFTKNQTLGLIHPKGRKDGNLPPKKHDAPVLEHWHGCNITYDGQSYIAIQWKFGKGAPSNPSCSPVTITRES